MLTSTAPGLWVDPRGRLFSPGRRNVLGLFMLLFFHFHFQFFRLLHPSSRRCQYSAAAIINRGDDATREPALWRKWKTWTKLDLYPLGHRRRVCLTRAKTCATDTVYCQPRRPTDRPPDGPRNGRADGQRNGRTDERTDRGSSINYVNKIGGGGLEKFDSC